MTGSAGARSTFAFIGVNLQLRAEGESAAERLHALRAFGVVRSPFRRGGARPRVKRERDLTSAAELALDKEGRFLALRAVNTSNLGASAISFVPLAKGIAV